MCIHAAAYILLSGVLVFQKGFANSFLEVGVKAERNKMEKVFLYFPPVSGLAQPLLPRGPHSPPPPFLFLLRPSTSAAHIVAGWTSSAARLPLLASAADGRVPRSSATARWDRPVRLVFHLESEPVASRIQQPRAIRANKSGFCPIAILYIPPEAPLAPQVIPSRSHHAEFAKAAAEIRRIFKSAAAVRPEPREQRAELLFRFAKSPEFSFCSFELSVPR